jgi:predicted enzyme related to lactoylglutathione lyase
MGNPVVHFEIVGKDQQKLHEFYQQAFGWRIGPPLAGGFYAMAFPDGGAGINGGIGRVPDDAYPGHVTFYVGVPDVNEALETVQRLGAQPVMGPIEVPDGPTIAQFRDPEGHLVGLVQTETMRTPR